MQKITDFITILAWGGAVGGFTIGCIAYLYDRKYNAKPKTMSDALNTQRFQDMANGVAGSYPWKRYLLLGFISSIWLLA